MTLASLPMYWRAETAAYWRAFWSVVQDCAADDGMSLPDLTPPDALPGNWHAHWRSPDLVLSMTCGLPFRTALRDQVAYVGTLDFGLGGPVGHYHSQVIARRDLTGPPRTLAFNSADSQSGWAAAQDLPDRAGITTFRATGSHAASLAAVAEGSADIACLDAVTWRILKAVDPNAARVVARGTTRPTPGLPLITARGSDPAPLRQVLSRAVTRFTAPASGPMGAAPGFCVLDEQTYLQEPIPAPPPA